MTRESKGGPDAVIAADEILKIAKQTVKVLPVLVLLWKVLNYIEP